jgi:hypothetical protein
LVWREVEYEWKNSVMDRARMYYMRRTGAFERQLGAPKSN